MQDELGRCAAQSDITGTYAAAIFPRAGVYPRWIARGRMIRMIQSPGRGHSGGSGGYPPCQAIGLASAPAYVNAAERRADTEMRDAGETLSVMGAGPEASARAIGGDTRRAAPWVIALNSRAEILLKYSLLLCDRVL